MAHAHGALHPLHITLHCRFFILLTMAKPRYNSSDFGRPHLSRRRVVAPGRSRRKMGEMESRRVHVGQREGMSSVPPRKAGGWISMRVCVKSKSPAFLAACGFFFAGCLHIAPCLRAAQIDVITDQNGQSVYVTANGSAPGRQPFERSGFSPARLRLIPSSIAFPAA